MAHGAEGMAHGAEGKKQKERCAQG